MKSQTLPYYLLCSLFIPLIHAASNQDPLALHQLYTSLEDEETIIDLSGYDLNGDKTTALITSLPKYGTLYRTTYNYSKMMRSSSSLSTANKKNAADINRPILDSDLPYMLISNNNNKNNIVVYKKTKNNNIIKQTADQFTYKVTDVPIFMYDTTSKTTSIDMNDYKWTDGDSIVTILSDDRSLLKSSDFKYDNEGWTVNGNTLQQNTPYYEASSRGLDMNHFIYASDDLINTKSENQINSNDDEEQSISSSSSKRGIDLDLWYFQAPEKYHGWHGSLYNGFFEFILSSFSGDFSSLDKYNIIQPSRDYLHLVEMECQECAKGKGITLAYPIYITKQSQTQYHQSKHPTSSSSSEKTLLEHECFSSECSISSPFKQQQQNYDYDSHENVLFDGKTTKYILKMNESSGWLKDPKNTLFKWKPPTKCEFIQVISNISSMKILGDFTKWYETVSLDNVQWIVNTQKKNNRTRMKIIPVCAQLTTDARKCTCDD